MKYLFYRLEEISSIHMRKLEIERGFNTYLIPLQLIKRELIS